MRNCRMLIFMMILALLAGNAYAADDPNGHEIFLRLDGVQGECREPGFEGWIKLLSFTHTSIDDGKKDRFTLRYEIDNSSQKLFEAMRADTPIATGDAVYCERKDGRLKASYRLKLEKIKVTSAFVNPEYWGDDGTHIIVIADIDVEKTTWVTDPGDLPKTGDSAYPLLWALTAAVSCMTAVLLKRKQNIPQ